MAKEWGHLCSQALTSSAVTDEPLIHSGQDFSKEDSGADAEPIDKSVELRGDIAAHGFWKRGMSAVFDVRITDTDNPSQRGKAPQDALARHERQKKAKYGKACQAYRKHFTPLVFSVDGLTGKETQAAMKRLASLLAAKWERSYSEVCGFVRSRLSLALVRSTHLCLRGSRQPRTNSLRTFWESGTGLALYQ